MSSSNKVQKVVGAANVIDARAHGDTIRVWESYREQAGVWRALALLQIPATVIAIIFAIVLWSTRSVTLNVPRNPAPGVYKAQDIPDTEFIDVATEFLNMVASYQPMNAERQFTEAARILIEPYLTRFKTEMIGTELQTIHATSRTQMFFPDPTKTVLERLDNQQVKVTFIGERDKIIAGKELTPVTSRFVVTMSTIPRHRLNPFGVVVVDFSAENLDR